MNQEEPSQPANARGTRSLGQQFDRDATAAALPSYVIGSTRSGLTSQGYATASVDVNSQASLDVDAARKEHKREKKDRKSKKQKKEKKAKKAKKEKRKKRSKSRTRESENAALHSSGVSSEEVKDLVSDQAEHHELEKKDRNGTLWRTNPQYDSMRTSTTAASSMLETPRSSASHSIGRTAAPSSNMAEQEQDEGSSEEEEEEHYDYDDEVDDKELEAVGGGVAHAQHYADCAEELEALGPLLPGETNEDRMLRLAMEVSLREFKLSRRNVLLDESPQPAMRSASVPPQRPPIIKEANTGVEDDISVRDGDRLVRQNSHRSLFSQATLEMTEVVVEDPRGKVKAQRRVSMSRESSHRAAAQPSSQRASPSHGTEAALRSSSRMSDRAGYPDNEPKAQYFEEEDNNDGSKSQFMEHDDDPMSHWEEEDIHKKFFDEQFDEEMFTEVARRPPARGALSSRPRRASPSTPEPAPLDQIQLARQNLSPEEFQEIKRALREAGEDPDEVLAASPRRPSTPPRQSEPSPRQESERLLSSSRHLSEDEAAEIARALQEADEEDARRSFQLALQLQSQEATLYTAERQMRERQASQPDLGATPQSAQVGAVRSYSPPVTRHPLDEGNGVTRPSQNWRRIRERVVGSGSEATQDAQLQAQPTFRRVGLSGQGEGFSENAAFNASRHSTERQTRVAFAHGRAMLDMGNSKSDGMDARVRMLVTRAINNRLIEKCNGIVKQGKEAVIYHADQGEEGGGFDVAIKVFKHIDEFRAHGAYMDGDPRFEDARFRNSSNSEQLEMWAEKEYRNLLRANRSGVPVPTPLIQKENVVFMRFLGEDGWAAPQMKELQIHKGSDQWTTLYSQIMVAIRRYVRKFVSREGDFNMVGSYFGALRFHVYRLFHGARLVHGDLSENNILVCPARLVENRDEGCEDDDFQAVLIDFGQAVDWRHPSAMDLLDRDLAKVREFFLRMGVKTLALNMAVDFVIAPEPDQEDDSTIGDDSKISSKDPLSHVESASATNSDIAAHQSHGAAGFSSRSAGSLAVSDRSSTQAEDTQSADRDGWENQTDGFQDSSWPADFTFDPFGHKNG